MALSVNDIQRIIDFGGLKPYVSKYRPEGYNPYTVAKYQGRGNTTEADWFNSLNRNDVQDLINKYPQIVVPIDAYTQGDQNIFGTLNTPLGAAAVMAAMLGAPVLGELGVGGAGVGSEIGALEANNALLGEIGAGAAGTGAASADVLLPSALETGGEAASNYGLGSGTSLSADAATNPLNSFYSTSNPTTAANLNTVSNLVGGGSEFNLGALDSLASNPLLPVTGAGIGGAELGATGSIIGSGDGLGVKTLPDVLRETGLNSLTPVDLSSQPNVNPSTPSTTNAKDIADALRRANQVRKLIGSTNRQPITNMQSAFNTLNAQGINQGTGLPAQYRAKNPFDFGQQQPIQDQLASLLRNNYGG
jgi:hypothetical protein